MDYKEFKHLESIPLDEDNLVMGENPETNIKSKSCLNLGFVTLNSLNRYRNLIEVNKEALVNADLTTFPSLVKLLEQFLVTSSNVSVIADLENTQITEHYRRRNITVSNLKILPDINYCQNLMYSKFKPWSSIYGSLAYYNILSEDFEEYYTPSEVIYYSAKEAIDYSRKECIKSLATTRDNNYRLLAAQYVDLYKTLDEDSESADDRLYSFSNTVITRTPLLALVYRDLEFYSKWIPKVFTWLESARVNGKFIKIENPSFNRERAQNTLVDIVNILLDNVLDQDNFSNLGSKFIRQTIDANLFNILDEIVRIRRISTYIKIDQVEYTLEEELVNEFFEVIDVNISYSKHREGSYLILNSLMPPGGYAMLLNLLGCVLLNRAYILAYREINNSNSIVNTSVYPRILRLIGLASICFTKTNLSHVISNGLNLMSTFKLNITNIEINNLLDI